MREPYIDPATVELRPGTRWVRLLLLLRDGPSTVGDLMRRSHQQGVAFQVERNKISQALRRMWDNGLTEKLPDIGWVLTPNGRAAIERYLSAQRPTVVTPAAPATPRPVSYDAFDVAELDRRETGGRPAKRLKLRKAA